MRKTLAIAAIALIPATALADGATKAPGDNGLTIGPDGKMWRMEGCAAHPVEARAGARSKPVTVRTKAAEEPKKLAQSRAAKTD